jgi:hypothetical protein
MGDRQNRTRGDASEETDFSEIYSVGSFGGDHSSGRKFKKTRCCAAVIAEGCHIRTPHNSVPMIPMVFHSPNRKISTICQLDKFLSAIPNKLYSLVRLRFEKD